MQKSLLRPCCSPESRACSWKIVKVLPHLDLELEVYQEEPSSLSNTQTSPTGTDETARQAGASCTWGYSRGGGSAWKHLPILGPVWQPRRGGTCTSCIKFQSELFVYWNVSFLSKLQHSWAGEVDKAVDQRIDFYCLGYFAASMAVHYYENIQALGRRLTVNCCGILLGKNIYRFDCGSNFHEEKSLFLSCPFTCVLLVLTRNIMNHSQKAHHRLLSPIPASRHAT